MPVHTERVLEQFSAVANAYLSSAVHSQGDDLRVLAEGVRARPGRVLDLGCGAGHVTYAVAPYAVDVVAYDLSSAMGEIVRQEAGRLGLTNVTTKQGAVERVPFEEKSFDWVCTRYSAHHWSDVLEALGEAKRVLRSDGSLVVVDVCSPGIPLLDSHLQAVELLRDGSHVRDYSVWEWEHMAEQKGFKLVSRLDWKLPLDFKSWISRMKTPPVFAEAILSLFKAAPLEIKDYFQVGEDGSFVPDACLLELSIA